jgi:phage terminase large subunit-like protein
MISAPEPEDRDDNIEDLIKGLSEDELVALNAYVEDKAKMLKSDPLRAHMFMNDAQTALRRMKKDYRVLCGANKVGKTDEAGFILTACAKGRAEEFGIDIRGKKGPFKIWYCGRDRNVLSDAPLENIKKYLKGEGIDHRTAYSGQTILKMDIWDDEAPDPSKTVTEVLFKPYNGEKKIWESANVDFVFMDEEPPRHVFNAVKTKIAFKNGIVFMTMTPDDGISWTFDLFEGLDPDHGELIKNGYMEIYEATVFDNLRQFPVQGS